MALGTVILWVAWLFFNGGSTLSMQTARQNSSSKVINNTLLSAGAAGLVATYFKPLIMRTYKVTARWDIATCCNGVLAGCVSITGACDRCENWAAIIIGIIGAFAYIGWCKLLDKLGIDDPVEASAVHGAGGIWGLIAVAFFDNTTGVIYPIETRGMFLGI